MKTPEIKYKYKRFCSKCGKVFSTNGRFSRVCPNCDSRGKMRK